MQQQKVGARVAGLAGEPPTLAWMGLVSQAGVTSGSDPDQCGVPGLGRQALCADRVMITLHETIGPILSAPRCHAPVRWAGWISSRRNAERRTLKDMFRTSRHERSRAHLGRVVASV